MLPTITTAAAIGIEERLAKLMASGTLEEWHDRGVVEGEDPFAFHAQLLSFISGCGNEIVRKTFEIGSGIDNQLIAVVGLGKEVCTKRM